MDSKLGEINDDVVEYQMSKVDQGGDVSDILEDYMHHLAEEWGFPIEDDEASPYYGDMRLPDGRYARMYLVSEIVDPKEDSERTP